MYFGWFYQLEEITLNDNLSSSQLKGQNCGKTFFLAVADW
jgi:hypothetical protein